LVAICIIFPLVTPSFLSPGNLINVIRQASINIVLATGMTFVILTGGIDLSVGSILSVTAVVGVLVSLIPGAGLLAVPAAWINPDERVLFLAVSCQRSCDHYRCDN
jgi:ribose transport system permease protein